MSAHLKACLLGLALLGLVCSPALAGSSPTRLGPKQGVYLKLSGGRSFHLAFTQVKALSPTKVKLKSKSEMWLVITNQPPSTTFMVDCKVEVEPADSQFTITEEVHSSNGGLTGSQTGSAVDGHLIFAVTTGEDPSYWYSMKTSVRWSVFWCEVTPL